MAVLPRPSRTCGGEARAGAAASARMCARMYDSVKRLEPMRSVSCACATAQAKSSKAASLLIAASITKRSGHVLPAVHFDDLPGDIARKRLGREEQECADAFVCSAEALHRDGCLERFQHLRR